MRPNTMGIGRFYTSRVLGGADKLFRNVYKVSAYSTQSKSPRSNLELEEVAFIHLHNDGAYVWYYINENGYCTQCGKFLATHKKLEVMAGLKELNETI